MVFGSSVISSVISIRHMPFAHGFDGLFLEPLRRNRAVDLTLRIGGVCRFPGQIAALPPGPMERQTLLVQDQPGMVSTPGIPQLLSPNCDLRVRHSDQRLTDGLV